MVTNLPIKDFFNNSIIIFVCIIKIKKIPLREYNFTGAYSFTNLYFFKSGLKVTNISLKVDFPINRIF